MVAGVYGLSKTMMARFKVGRKRPMRVTALTAEDGVWLVDVVEEKEETGKNVSSSTWLHPKLAVLGVPGSLWSSTRHTDRP